MIGKQVTSPPNKIYDDKLKKNVVNEARPKWLPADLVHTITAVRHNGWGTLIKTDRIATWINYKWFRPIG